MKMLLKDLAAIAKRCLGFALLLAACTALGQVNTSGKRDTVFPTFYQQRSSLFRLMPSHPGDIIFLGNSITNGNEWGELFNDVHIKNRGISGDVTAGVLNRLDEVIYRRPAKVFLLIGINDLAAGVSPDTVAERIFEIARRITQQTPATKLYVQSLLPVNNAFNKFVNHVNKLEQIKQVNLVLQKGAGTHGYTFINLFPAFCNKDGKLDTLYTNDGLHQKGAGYMLWKHLIYPYVYNLQDKPSLLPQPQAVNWTADRFPLYLCRQVLCSNPSLMPEAQRLQQTLLEMGWQTAIVTSEARTGGPIIILEQKKLSTPGINDEAYKLSVDQNTVRIQANTVHGCFNALQTLFQLMRDETFIPGVNITDYPTFPWRGYMVDVGRNYLSVPLLKQQIGMMARYKLNVFHFHLTEDVAWRLQITRYPELTEARQMLRNPGAFYTVNELKDLIAFCKERYIKLVPEIDMPGHSAAFKRTFHCDMQSDSGLAIVKNIMKEVCTTYDIDEIHIGGDEVKINNPAFLPAITRYIEAMGKKIIGWSPGGNLQKGTIRQLWMSEGPVDPHLNYIDSRNLYINHMDPLESVVSIFQRQIGDSEKKAGNVLGAELCLWHDRNVIAQEDVLTMNPVYPAMLTFAELSWRGGGIKGWHATLLTGSPEFAEFETRLIDQQTQYFSNLPFPYVRQADIKWTLYGPYPNYGVLTTKFAPEVTNFKPDDQSVQQVSGGTIILRHFWHPKVSGVLLNPHDSTTYYAASKVWSNADTTALMWIGFNNLSRSTSTASPAAGTWDDRNSCIWLNQQLISPPAWLHAGQQGDLEHPLTDEGYEYRPPIAVHLHQGWNNLLVKLPIGSFRSGKVQNLVKWMFTALFVKPLGRNFIADDQLKYADQ